MFHVLVLGARASGKTTLATRCLTKQQTEPTKHLNSSRTFDVIAPEDVQDTHVLDPKPNALEENMLRELASRNIVAALLALPRDAQDPIHDMQRWAAFARQLCPRPQLAVVVTKTHTLNPPMPLHQFEQSVLNSMCTIDVKRIFYTNVKTNPPHNLRCWLNDILDQRTRDPHHSRNTHSCWNPAEDPISNSLPLLSEYTHFDKQRTCDRCHVS